MAAINKKMMSKKINKKSAFNDFMCDWQRFDDASYVLSAELFLTKEDALKKLQEEFDGWDKSKWDLDFKIENIGEDWVRFGCHGVDWESGEPACMWWLGSEGKRGAKPVWTYRLKLKPKV